MNIRAYAEMSIATVLYGLTFPLTAILLRSMGPLYLSAARSLWSFLFFAVYFLARGYPKRPQYKLLAGITIFGLVLPLILQNFGMLYTTASLASIIQSTPPVFVVLLAFLLLKEKLTAPKVAGAAVGILGTVVVMFQGIEGSLYGNILMACSAVSLAILAILEKVTLSKHTPIEILGVTSLMAFPVLLLAALPLEPAPAMDAGSLLLTVALSLGCTILPYFFWLDGLKDLEVSRAIVFSYGIPAFGIVFSVIMLHETVTLRMMAGMLMIFLSIWVAQR